MSLVFLDIILPGSTLAARATSNSTLERVTGCPPPPPRCRL